MKLIEWYYDVHCNKTHAKIEYRGSVDWYWISGRMAEREIVPTMAAVVERQAADMLPAEYSPDCPSCLRGLPHTFEKHEANLRRVYAASVA